MLGTTLAKIIPSRLQPIAAALARAVRRVISMARLFRRFTVRLVVPGRVVPNPVLLVWACRSSISWCSPLQGLHGLDRIRCRVASPAPNRLVGEALKLGGDCMERFVRFIAWLTTLTSGWLKKPKFRFQPSRQPTLGRASELILSS